MSPRTGPLSTVAVGDRLTVILRDRIEPFAWRTIAVLTCGGRKKTIVICDDHSRWDLRGDHMDGGDEWRKALDRYAQPMVRSWQAGDDENAVLEPLRRAFSDACSWAKHRREATEKARKHLADEIAAEINAAHEAALAEDAYRAAGGVLT